MIPDNYQTLFEKLRDRTATGDVNWKPTADENAFAVHLREFSLTMRRGRDPSDGTDFVRFELLNAAGKEIDGFWVDSSESGWQLALELFERGRRKAVRLDDALNAIMEELDKSDSIGLDKKPSASPFDSDDDDLPF